MILGVLSPDKKSFYYRKTEPQSVLFLVPHTMFHIEHLHLFPPLTFIRHPLIFPIESYCITLLLLDLHHHIPRQMGLIGMYFFATMVSRPCTFVFNKLFNHLNQTLAVCAWAQSTFSCFGHIPWLVLPLVAFKASVYCLYTNAALHIRCGLLMIFHIFKNAFLK